jgi:predicted  nucleic acid-binding Zn-ribbon protein
VTTAPAADQLRLLDVQALDTRAAQLAHRRRTHPILADLEAARAERAELDRARVQARTEVSDLRREVAKAEADVEQVRTRAARDRTRLDAGTGTARDLTALTLELDSLARRQAVLEEVELEAMERLEAAEARLEAHSAAAESAVAREADLADRAGAALGEIDAEAADVAARREASVAGLDAALVALYERVRAHSGGLGAAALRATRCEGCRLELNPIDLARIRSAPADEVVRCEECGRILVRVPAAAG